MTTLDQQIAEAGTYGPGGTHAIVVVPGSKWRIVDSVWSLAGQLLELGIHYDADAPGESPLDPSNWLHDEATHSRALYLRHTRPIRMALRRATDCSTDDSLREAENRARLHLALAQEVRANPGGQSYVVHTQWGIAGIAYPAPHRTNLTPRPGCVRMTE